MALKNDPAVPDEIDRIRDRGSVESVSAGKAMALVVGVEKAGMRAADPFYVAIGACQGLYVFRFGDVLAVCHIDPGPWIGRLDVWVLTVGQIGHDGPESAICGTAHARRP